jgi:probable rRNA maturation factor
LRGEKQKMQLFVNDEQDKVSLTEEACGLIERALELTLICVENPKLKIGQKNDVEISLMFVDDEQIQEMNRDYRQMDRSTDVLSFALCEDTTEPEFHNEEDHLLGDIVISLETAKRQAEEYGHSLEREVAYLATHGCLHLLGYDHLTEDEQKEMRLKEEEVLNQIGLIR